VKLRKPWIPEIFKDYYCVTRKKPITRERTKPQTLAVIGHVRYINVLTWLRGFQDKLLCLVVFSMYPSLFWELKDKGNLKILQFLPESLGSTLEYWYIERGQLVVVFACPELYSDWFSTKLTFWNQIQMFTFFSVSWSNQKGLHKFKIHCPNSWVLAFPNFMAGRPFPVRDHLWYNLWIISGPGIICGTIWGSFAVRGSFAGRDHLRGRTYPKSLFDI